MSAVPATAPHYVHNHFAHLKRVGQPKINAKHKVRVGKGGQKKKKKTRNSPRDPETMESRGISAAFHNENRAQNGKLFH